MHHLLAACLPSLGPIGLPAGAAPRSERACAARPTMYFIKLVSPCGIQALMTCITDKSTFAKVASRIRPRQLANLHKCTSTASSAFIDMLPFPLSANIRKATRASAHQDPTAIVSDSGDHLSNAQLQPLHNVVSHARTRLFCLQGLPPSDTAATFLWALWPASAKRHAILATHPAPAQGGLRDHRLVRCV